MVHMTIKGAIGSMLRYFYRMETVRLRPKEHQRLLGGHQWVFRNEISQTPQAELGEIVRVVSHSDRFLGIGFYHPTSRIAVRIISDIEERIDVEFFAKRIQRALELRHRLLPQAEAYRLVFGEADMLSGLIVDRFDNTLVMQMHSAGMDVRINEIVDALRHVIPDVTGIVERNTMGTRVQEGLPHRDGVVWGSVPDRITFLEGPANLEIDVLGGQKTGYFLDQRINREWIGKHVSGKRVLDAFCNVGGFSLHAGHGGAAHVVGIDSSATAIAAATHHATINNLSQVQFRKANMFDALREYAANEEQWDVIILDPPSFAKSRQSLGGARAGYAELNRSALKLIPSGGLLVSASCTQLFAEHDLLDVVYEESARLRRTLRLVHRGNQAPDHPVLLAMPETQYLKFLVFEVW